jgi:hypothetical protein
MKKPSVRLQKLLLALYFVLGGTFTFYLTVERIREDQNIYAIVTVLAIFFDVLFFKTLFSLLNRRAIPRMAVSIGKAFSSIFRRIGRLVERVSDAFSSDKDKTFMEGKSERTFVFETHTSGTGQTKRRLPRLTKNASEREKIRYEYTCYVFKKDKNISSTLTPNEVGHYLDETGEDHAIFENYNEARYTDE